VTAEGLRLGFSNILGVEFEGYKHSAADRMLGQKLVREKYTTDVWNRR
jgi:lipoate-protein ligase A